LVSERLRLRAIGLVRTSTLARFKDEPLEDLDSLPEPSVIAREIIEDLSAALAEFEAVAAATAPRRASLAPGARSARLPSASASRSRRSATRSPVSALTASGRAI
jgi:hypothetical protein